MARRKKTQATDTNLAQVEQTDLLHAAQATATPPLEHAVTAPVDVPAAPPQEVVAAAPTMTEAPAPLPPAAPTAVAQPAPPREPPVVGLRLREARQNMGLDLPQIEQQLRIKAEYLAALENSQYELLPANAYTIGFLRTYGNFLGLNGEALLDDYRAEMQGRAKGPTLVPPAPITDGATPGRELVWGAAAALLVLLGWLLWQPTPAPAPTAPELLSFTPPAPTNEEAETTPASPVAETIPANASGEATNPAPSTTTPVAASPVPAAPSAAPPAVAPAPAAEAKPPASATPAANTPPNATANGAPVAVPAPTPPPTINKPANNASPAASAPTAPPVAPSAATPASAAVAPKPVRTNSNLALRATEPVNVSITDSNGVVVETRQLQAGEVMPIPAGNGLRLAVGNMGALRLLQSGQEGTQPMGRPGEAASNINLDRMRAPSSATSNPPIQATPATAE